MITLDYQTDSGAGTRASLGLIVLQADETIEPFMMRALNLEGVALYHARIPSDSEITAGGLQKTKHEIETAAGLFPAGLCLDAVAYACTSASALIGESAVEALVQRHQPNALVTNPFSAAKVALNKLKARRIGLVSPYGDDVVASLCQTLQVAGFEIGPIGSFQQTTEASVARIDEASILKAIIEVSQSEQVEAVFVSCTNLRAASVIDAAEAALGIPVVSSNQAIAWHLLRLAGVGDEVDGYGQLLKIASL